MARRGVGLFLFGIAPGLAALAWADEQPFQFTIDTDLSGFSGTTYMAANAHGSLFGSFEPARNPGGSRTKPGTSGPFGPEENLAVPTAFAFAMAAQQNTVTSGEFQITFDRVTKTMQFSNFLVNLLAAGSQPGDSTVTVQTDGFQTRAPDGVIQGGSARQVPAGTATLTELVATQANGGFGTMVRLTENSYSFTAGVPVDLHQRVRILGVEYDLAPMPYALMFQGNVFFNGTTAELTSIQAIDQDDVQYPNAPLPQLAFSLPTDQPVGPSAELLADLTLDQVISRINGQTSLFANGTQIPEPASLALVGAALALCLGRSRIARH